MKYQINHKSSVTIANTAFEENTILFLHPVEAGFLFLVNLICRYEVQRQGSDLAVV